MVTRDSNGFWLFFFLLDDRSEILFFDTLAQKTFSETLFNKLLNSVFILPQSQQKKRLES